MNRHSAEMKLRLVEIFSAIQGEGVYVGERQLFVRLGGCNLRCVYCDQPETLDATQIPRYRVEQNAGKRDFVWRENLATVADVVEAIEKLDQPRGLHRTVSITGGEPLLQPSGLRALLPTLRERGYRIYCDTNGMLPLHAAQVADLMDVVAMDIKLPSSTGEPPFWKEHAEFLKVFEPSQVFVKVVVDENFKWDEIENVCRVIAGHDENIPLILQPVTPFAASGKPPSPDVMLELQAFCKRFLPDVRVIPQTHKMIGQL
jgi:organic radical activating enzyme